MKKIKTQNNKAEKHLNVSLKIIFKRNTTCMQETARKIVQRVPQPSNRGNYFKNNLKKTGIQEIKSKMLSNSSFHKNSNINLNNKIQIQKIFFKTYIKN